MKPSDFTHLIDFPLQRRSVVYVFFCEIAKGELPFYVGETERFAERMGDYFRAQFAAPTDFKVGEAVRYLTNKKNHRIRVGYRECADRETAKQEEIKLIRLFKERQLPLLNDLAGYRYKAADKAEETRRVREFCDKLIATVPSRAQ